MPLRSDSTLWFNLPGVVAAYQPVMCPGGSLLARYNMAHGGDNRYLAMPGASAVGWSGVNGWSFTAGTTSYLDTGIVPSIGYGVAGRFSQASQPALVATIIGAYSGNATSRLAVMSYRSTAPGYASGNATNVGTYLLSAVQIASGRNGFQNGNLIVNNLAGITTAPSVSLWIGNDNGNATAGLTGYIKAIAVYARVLSVSEAMMISRQMAYCDVNPSWSVWGRRRQWYYRSSLGFNPAWATQNNKFIGGGTP